MKKNLLIISSLVSFLSLTLLVGKVSGETPFLKAEATEYSLSLDSKNAYVNGEVSKEIKTRLGNTVRFSYEGASSVEGGHVILSEGGKIYNTDQITGGNKVVANFIASGEGRLIYKYGNSKEHMRTTYLVSGSELFNPSYGDYRYVCFEASGSPITISSIALSYSCEAEANQYGKPTIAFEGATTGEARQGDEFTLPTVKAVSYDGFDLTSDVKITDSLGETVKVADKVFKSNVTGIHTLTYSVTDLGETTTATVTIRVYQRVFTNYGSAKITLENESTNPVAKTSDTGIGIKGFYLPSGASKQYYAEYTVSKVSNVTGDMLICAANFTSNDLGPSKEYPIVYFGYKPQPNGSFELANSKLMTGWDALGGPRMWSGTDMLNGIVTIDPFNADTKFAVARDGNNVYYFLNDVLVYVDVNPALFNLNSVPGILLNGNGSVAPNVTLSNFTILEGAAAIAKLNEAKPASQFRYYSPYGDTLKNQPASFQKDGFTYLDKVADNGIGFNDAMVTSNELYTNTSTKKWKVSFDMQATKFGNGGEWGKMNFDFRTFHDKKTVTKLSLEQYLNNFTGVKFEWSEVGGTDSDHLAEFQTAMTGVKVTDKLHFELSCYTSGSNQETYDIKISSTGENPVSWSTSKVIAYNDGSKYMVGCPKYVVWHAEKWSGVLSNYSLSFEDVVTA